MILPAGTRVLVLPGAVGILNRYIGCVGIVVCPKRPWKVNNLIFVQFEDRPLEAVRAYIKELQPLNLSKLDKAYYGL